MTINETLRPEVLACQKRAQELRADADEMDEAADFWALLVDHRHADGETCEDFLCLEAWRMYPDG